MAENETLDLKPALGGIRRAASFKRARARMSLLRKCFEC